MCKLMYKLARPEKAVPLVFKPRTLGETAVPLVFGSARRHDSSERANVPGHSTSPAKPPLPEPLASS